MIELFVRRMREMLHVEQTLANDVIPALRERAHAPDLVAALDRHLLETEGHVKNLQRALAFVGERDVAVETDALAGLGAAEGDVGILDAVIRIEHLEVGFYTSLVQMALELADDPEVARLLRLNKEQDAHALEQAEHELAKILAEKAPTA